MNTTTPNTATSGAVFPAMTPKNSALYYLAATANTIVVIGGFIEVFRLVLDIKRYRQERKRAQVSSNLELGRMT
jgi:hypothetical protein